uniref:Uncharacterized protein n=1 Tax=Anopheles culicifacies TaxID=139723 RepID=A0A182MH06_9DIPT
MLTAIGRQWTTEELLSAIVNQLTDFVFLCGLASRKIDSAHSSPALGQSCNARAISVLAISFIPARISMRIAANHRSAFFGFFSRPRSSTERAFVSRFRFSSSAANNSHSGMELGHRLNPALYDSAARSSISFCSSICPFIIHSLANSGKTLTASSSKLSASSRLLRAHSSLADFIITRGVGAEARAFASNRRARSYSAFSDSSFTAANQMSSEFGLAWKASERIPRAAGTSPANHFDFAPINHNTSDCGQWATAFCSSASRLSRVP